MQTSQCYHQALGGASETHGSNKQRVFIVNLKMGLIDVLLSFLKSPFLPILATQLNF